MYYCLSLSKVLVALEVVFEEFGALPVHLPY